MPMHPVGRIDHARDPGGCICCGAALCEASHAAAHLCACSNGCLLWGKGMCEPWVPHLGSGSEVIPWYGAGQEARGAQGTLQHAASRVAVCWHCLEPEYYTCLLEFIVRLAHTCCRVTLLLWSGARMAPPSHLPWQPPHPYNTTTAGAAHIRPATCITAPCLLMQHDLPVGCGLWLCLGYPTLVADGVCCCLQSQALFAGWLYRPMCMLPHPLEALLAVGSRFWLVTVVHGRCCVCRRCVVGVGPLVLQHGVVAGVSCVSFARQVQASCTRGCTSQEGSPRARGKCLFLQRSICLVHDTFMGTHPLYPMPPADCRIIGATVL
jgi:hypothetical protein